MKFRLFVAFTFMFVGLSYIIDWFVFSSEKRELKTNNYEQFYTEYTRRFPAFLQGLFPQISTWIIIVILAIAGILFLKANRRVFFILGILSFILSFWNLFSLM